MITKIEIDGFKSFQNFSIDLKPFQVLVGLNGVGKSNLFDAIVLLSKLAQDQTVYQACEGSRGDISELFTIYPDGSRAREMRFAVEMLIAKSISDDLGNTEGVSSTRVRYELRIERRMEDEFERLYVTYESLTAITGDDDVWVRNMLPTQKRGNWIERGRRVPYISTDDDYIYKHQDRRAGRKQQNPLGKIQKTILSTISIVEYPTAYAVKQEMLSWMFLQLNPEVLRTPSSVRAPSQALKHDASNLATLLYRMKKKDEFVLNDISIDMANIVPGIRNISVEPLPEREEYIIEAHMENDAIFSSQVLSDGTLRLLTLVTLKHDPHHQGVLCFEEPENGVHPSRLQDIVDILRSTATDFESDENQVLSQVLINTHSSQLMSYVPAESLIYVYMPAGISIKTFMSQVEPGNQLALDLKSDERRFTFAQVKQILESASASVSERNRELAELEAQL